MSASKNTYIAVVDDDESVCLSFSRLLRTAGYHPVPFHSAEEFLSDRNRPHFDCLVFDVQLDGISGIELGKRLAAVGDNTPIVFITAHDDPAVQAEAEVTGCAGYFHKTNPGVEILSTIRNAIRSSGTQAANPKPSCH